MYMYTKSFQKTIEKFLESINFIRNIFGFESLKYLPEKAHPYINNHYEPREVIRICLFEDILKKYNNVINVRYEINNHQAPSITISLNDKYHNENIKNFYDCVSEGKDLNDIDLDDPLIEEYFESISDEDLINGVIEIEKDKINVIKDNHFYEMEQYENNILALDEMKKYKLSPKAKKRFVEKLYVKYLNEKNKENTDE